MGQVGLGLGLGDCFRLRRVGFGLVWGGVGIGRDGFWGYIFGLGVGQGGLTGWWVGFLGPVRCVGEWGFRFGVEGVVLRLAGWVLGWRVRWASRPQKYTSRQMSRKS